MVDELYYDDDKSVRVEKKAGVSHPTSTHYHAGYEIALFEHCDLRIFCQNKWFTAADGDIFIVPRLMIHRYDYLNMEQYTRVVINFTEDYMLPTLKALGCEALLINEYMRQCHKLTPTRGKFAQLLRSAGDALDVFDRAEQSAAAVDNGILRARLASMLYELLPLCRTHNMHSIQSESNAYIQQAIQYIDANFADVFSLDKLAQLLHIDKYYLCHIFKKHVGISIVKYLQYRRIMTAQKLMIYAPKPTDMIAAECGFGSLQNFYRVFREITGCTPAKYCEAANAVMRYE